MRVPLVYWSRGYGYVGSLVGEEYLQSADTLDIGFIVTYLVWYGPQGSTVETILYPLFNHKFSEQLKLETKIKDSQEGTYTWPDAQNPRGGIGLGDSLGGLTPGLRPETQGKVWIYW